MRTSMKTVTVSVLLGICLIGICGMGAVIHSTHHTTAAVSDNVAVLTRVVITEKSSSRELADRCARLEAAVAALTQPEGLTLAAADTAEPSLREKDENGVPVKYAEFHQATIDSFTQGFEQTAGRRVPDVFKQKASQAVVKFIDRHTDAEMDAMIALPMPGQGTAEQAEEFFRVTAELSTDILQECQPYLTTALSL